MMRLSRLRVISSPSLMGSAAPERLVPLPRATNGTSCLWQMRTASITSSCVSGITTAAGRVL